jgi:four helix bundle protein
MAHGRPPRDIEERAFALAREVVELCERLSEQSPTRRVLAAQLAKAGTSIGANLEEAVAGQSRADFVAKTAIALKEARETLYWLRLVAATTEPA